MRSGVTGGVLRVDGVKAYMKRRGAAFLTKTKFFDGLPAQAAEKESNRHGGVPIRDECVITARRIDQNGRTAGKLAGKYVNVAQA